MPEYIFIAIMLIAVPIFRVDGPFGLDQAKNALFILLAGISLSTTIITGLPEFTGTEDTALMIFVLYASISILWSEYPKKAAQETVRLWAVLWFYKTASIIDSDFLLSACFLPAPIISAYGIIQQIFRYDPFDKRIQKKLNKKTRFLSFFGNSNYTAAYLAPQIFIGIQLTGQHSPWIIMPGLVIVAAGLILSQCRAAMLSALGGIVAIMPESIPFIIILLFLILYKNGYGESAGHRFILSRACMEMWKKRPILGWGPYAFRIKLYRIIADLNNNNPEILGDRRRPGKYTFTQARRAHNDYAETLVEYGIAGAAIFSVFLYSIIHRAVENPTIMAGIITTMLNAFLFYPFRDTTLSLPFFSMAAYVNTITSSTYTMPAGIKILCAMTVFYIIYLYAFKPFMGNLHYTRDDPDSALSYDPFNNTYLYRKAIKHLSCGDRVTAFVSLEKMIQHPDGEGLEYSMLNAYGKTAILNGAYHLAMRSFQTSVMMNPSSKESMEGLKQAKSIINFTENKNGRTG